MSSSRQVFRPCSALKEAVSLGSYVSLNSNRAFPGRDMRRTYVQILTSNLQIKARAFRFTDLICVYSALTRQRLDDHGRLEPSSQIWSITLHLWSTVFPYSRTLTGFNYQSMQHNITLTFNIRIIEDTGIKAIFGNCMKEYTGILLKIIQICYQIITPLLDC